MMNWALSTSQAFDRGLSFQKDADRDLEEAKDIEVIMCKKMKIPARFIQGLDAFSGISRVHTMARNTI